MTNFNHKQLEANLLNADFQKNVDEGEKRHDLVMPPVTIYNRAGNRGYAMRILKKNSINSVNRAVDLAMKNKFKQKPHYIKDKRKMSGEFSNTQQGLNKIANENFKKAKKNRKLDVTPF